jgi:hypothetical protein
VGNRPAGEWRRVGHWRESYAAIAGRVNQHVHDQHVHDSRRKTPQSGARIVFLSLGTGGQKGGCRESRNRLILLMRNFRVCQSVRYTF